MQVCVLGSYTMLSITYMHVWDFFHSQESMDSTSPARLHSRPGLFGFNMQIRGNAVHFHGPEPVRFMLKERQQVQTGNQWQNKKNSGKNVTEKQWPLEKK